MSKGRKCRPELGFDDIRYQNLRPIFTGTRKIKLIKMVILLHIFIPDEYFESRSLFSNLLYIPTKPSNEKETGTSTNIVLN